MPSLKPVSPVISEEKIFLKFVHDDDDGRQVMA